MSCLPPISVHSLFPISIIISLKDKSIGGRTQLKELTGIFALDVCAYAVMSNPCHGVLRVDSARAQSWSTEEVISRWRRLFRGGVLVERFLKGEATTRAERDKVAELAAQWRERLADISGFMRCLNESIAR
jgi:putative transposase